MVNDIVEIFIHLGFEHVKIVKFYYYDMIMNFTIYEFPQDIKIRGNVISLHILYL